MSEKERIGLGEKVARLASIGAVALPLYGCRQSESKYEETLPPNKIVAPYQPPEQPLKLVFAASPGESRPGLVTPEPTVTPQVETPTKEIVVAKTAEPTVTVGIKEEPTARPEEVTLAEVVKEGDYIHTVAAGETLSEIAKQYNLPLKEIIQANPQIENINLLSIGQAVIIPNQPTPEVEAKGGPDPLATPEAVPTAQHEVVLPVPIDAQDFSLSCESSASAMVAAYFEPEPPRGFENWEEYFVKTVPLNCNPHEGFRGKIDGYLSTSCDAPNGYGVYAEPLADAFQKASIPAKVEYGVDYEAVAKAIREGYPVIVWISGKSVEPKYETDPETGEEYPLLLGEHVWVVIGVLADNQSFLINDPWQGKQFWRSSFPRWDVFEGMRLVVGEKEAEAPVNNLFPQ